MTTPGTGSPLESDWKMSTKVILVLSIGTVRAVSIGLEDRAVGPVVGAGLGRGAHALARGELDREDVVVEESVLDHAHQHEDEDRQDEGEFDEALTSFGRPPAARILAVQAHSVARPLHSNPTGHPRPWPSPDPAPEHGSGSDAHSSGSFVRRRGSTRTGRSRASRTERMFGSGANRATLGPCPTSSSSPDSSRPATSPQAIERLSTGWPRA